MRKLGPAYVYFIQCRGDRGPIKVGFAKNVEPRLLNHQIGNPYDLTVRAQVWVDEPDAVENSIHIHFAAVRIRGEWFAHTQEMESLIRRVNEYEQARQLSLITITPPPLMLREFTIDPFAEPLYRDFSLSAEGQELLGQWQRARAEAYNDNGPPAAAHSSKKKTVPMGFFEWRGKMRPL